VVDYWTGFSIELPVGAGNIDAALAIYAQFRDELDAGHQPIGFRAEKIGKRPSLTPRQRCWATMT